MSCRSKRLEPEHIVPWSLRELNQALRLGLSNEHTEADILIKTKARLLTQRVRQQNDDTLRDHSRRPAQSSANIGPRATNHRGKPKKRWSSTSLLAGPTHFPDAWLMTPACLLLVAIVLGVKLALIMALLSLALSSSIRFVVLYLTSTGHCLKSAEILRWIYLVNTTNKVGDRPTTANPGPPRG